MKIMTGRYLTTWGVSVDVIVHNGNPTVRRGTVYTCHCPVTTDGEILGGPGPREHIICRLPPPVKPGRETAEQYRHAVLAMGGPIAKRFEELGGALAPEGQVCRLITQAAGLVF